MISAIVRLMRADCSGATQGFGLASASFAGSWRPRVGGSVFRRFMAFADEGRHLTLLGREQLTPGAATGSFEAP